MRRRHTGLAIRHRGGLGLENEEAMLTGVGTSITPPSEEEAVKAARLGNGFHEVGFISKIRGLWEDGDLPPGTAPPAQPGPDGEADRRGKEQVVHGKAPTTRSLPSSCRARNQACLKTSLTAQEPQSTPPEAG